MLNINKLLIAVVVIGLTATAAHAQLQSATKIFVDNATPFESETTPTATLLSESTATILATSPVAVIGFRWKGENFSTGVNDARLDNNDIEFMSMKFRALPMNDVQTTSDSFYIAGLEASVDPNPDIYNTSPEQSVVAALLTDGQRGLDFTSGIYNHPLRDPPNTFVLASGIDASTWDDGQPDILFAQLGGSSTTVPLTLVDNAGNELGQLDVNALRAERPKWVLGQVNQDFFTIGSTANSVSSPQPRTVQLFAADISEFTGLTQAELADADRLQLQFNGEIDFAFLAINEDSIASASALQTEQEPTGCDPSNVLTPAPIVQVVDSDGNSVAQPGIAVRAEDADPGDAFTFSGDTEEITDNSGRATFDNLIISPGCPTDTNLVKFTFVLNAEGLDPAAPTAVDDSASVPENGAVSIDVLSNDSFGGDGPSADAIAISTAPGNGTAMVDDGGTPNDPTDDRIDYTPNTGFSGNDSFVYSIKDADGDQASATVMVTVTVEPIVLQPETGFNLTWDGNDGVNFNGPVPDNLALSGPDATPFASTVFGSPHTIAGLNDGQYGNSSSWLAAASDTDPHAGVTFSGGVQIDAIAFGRDNTGDLNDRYDGTYSLQFTTDLGASRTWTSFGDITLAF